MNINKKLLTNRTEYNQLYESNTNIGFGLNKRNNISTPRSVNIPEPVAQQRLVGQQRLVAQQRLIAPQRLVAPQTIIAAPTKVVYQKPVISNMSITQKKHTQIFKPEPVVRHEPVISHEPVVRHEPVIQHEPVVSHEPIVRPEPVVRHEPINKNTMTLQIPEQITKDIVPFSLPLQKTLDENIKSSGEQVIAGEQAIAGEQVSAVQQAVKVIDLFATFYIENIVNALAKILRDCGLEVYVNIRSLENEDIKKCQREEGRFLFICCPQTLLQAKNGPVYPTSLIKLPLNKYFLYQFEQLDTDSNVKLNDNFINLVKGSKHTFDYSEVNLAYYPKDIAEKVSVLLPPVVEITTDVTEKKYDILFCGYANQRRENILNELRKAGYNVLHVIDVFGSALTKLISEAKIFLNLHHANSKCLETCRLNEAVMSNDTHIISEKGDCDKLYDERVHFTETANILKTVKEVLVGENNEYNIKLLMSKIYTNTFIKIKLLNYNINYKTINNVNTCYLNYKIDTSIELDGDPIRNINSFIDTVMLYRKNSLTYYIDSIESFYKLYVDFDLSYYKNKYYKQTTLSDIKIMYDFHTIDYYKGRVYNDKIKIVIYTPALYDKCGGIKALHRLAEQINNLKHNYIYAKLYCYDGSKYINKYCNDFANPFEINDNTIVIYPEIISGNPMKSKYVLRWILLDLGIEMSRTHFVNWGETDIVYHWEPNTTNNKIKQLSIPFLDEVFKNYNSTTRTKTCFIIKKGPLIHNFSDITYIHPNDSINIDNMSLTDIVKVFNESHTFYCYDPNTFYILSAPLCGCISVVYPIKNMSADSFYKNRITCIDDFIFNSGIAYGNSNEQIINARITIKDSRDNFNTLLSKYETTVSKFVEDIYDFFTIGKKLTTIKDVYN